MEKTIYDSVLESLDKTKGSWSQVAEGSGVPKRTLEKIARRETKNPGVSHIQALFDYFERESAEAR